MGVVKKSDLVGALLAVSGSLIIACVLLGSSFASAAHIDKEKIRQVVKKHEQEVRECYEAQLSREPDLKGKLVVDWEVNDVGTVVSAAANSKSTDLKNEAVTSCIVSKVKTWKFPPAPKGEKVTVSYPWSFSN